MYCLNNLFQMDPNRISEEDTHCLRTFLRLHGNIDLQDAALANQETRLLSESCRKMKQAFQGAMQKVSPAQVAWQRLLNLFVKCLFSEMCRLNHRSLCLLWRVMVPEIMYRIFQALLQIGNGDLQDVLLTDKHKGRDSTLNVAVTSTVFDPFFCEQH